jgi:hypothetical protein
MSPRNGERAACALEDTMATGLRIEGERAPAARAAGVWVTAGALAAVVGAGCQLDPGNFGGYQFHDPPVNKVSNIWVEDTGGGVTTEHWAFNNATYSDTLGIDTVNSGGSGSMTSFRDEACRNPVRSYMKVATTENALDCAHPVRPAVAAHSVSVLGDGSYIVRQEGREMGVVFVQNRVEHWAVKTSEFNRDRGFNVRPRPTAFSWASWARYACDNYNPRTYWVVTAVDGGRLCP